MNNRLKISVICLFSIGFNTLYSAERLDKCKVIAVRKLQEGVVSGISFAKNNPIKTAFSFAALFALYLYWKQQQQDVEVQSVIGQAIDDQAQGNFNQGSRSYFWPSSWLWPWSRRHLTITPISVEQ